MTNELTEYKGSSPVDNIKKLLGSGVSVKDLKEFLDLQKQWEEREAEKAFNIDMAEFKKEVPSILKTKHVRYQTKAGDIVEYDHADLGEIVEALIPALSKYGFNHSWSFDQTSNIKVTCTITHRLGYSKSNSLTAPPDTSGGKNTIQAISSAGTYLQRYTFLGSLGIAAKGKDDDGKGAAEEKKPDKKTITPETKVGWKRAKEAYIRDGNFKAVLEYANISEDNQKKIIEEIGFEESAKKEAMRGPNDLP